MYTPDITIHINQTLAAEQQRALEAAMRDIDGVIAPRFNLPHMLVILYNAQKTTSAELLATVRESGYQAQLVAL